MTLALIGIWVVCIILSLLIVSKATDQIVITDLIAAFIFGPLWLIIITAIVGTDIILWKANSTEKKR